MLRFLKVCILLFYVSFVGASNGFSFDDFNENILSRCSITTVFKNVKAIKVNYRNFYTLFTPHVTNQHAEAKIILSSQTDSMDEKTKKLRDLLLRNSNLVQSEEEDVSTIVSLLTKKPAIRWIGIELSKEDMQTVPSIRDRAFYMDAKKTLEIDTKLNPEEIRGVLYLMFVPPTVALAENPQLFQNIKLIPLDDDLYRKLTLKIVEPIVNRRRQIMERIRDILGQKDQIPYEEVFEKLEKFKKIEDIKSRAVESLREIPQSQIEAQSKEWKDPKMQSLVNAYYSTVNQFIRYGRKRDNTMASIALKQSGEGLITAGSAHARGVTTTLLSMCRGL